MSSRNLEALVHVVSWALALGEFVADEITLLFSVAELCRRELNMFTLIDRVEKTSM